MTRIVEVAATTVVVPLPAPTGFSSRTVSDRNYTLVRVTGDDGVSGIGFCYPGHRAGTLATRAISELLADVVVGGDAHMTQQHWARMYQEALLHGRVGSVMRAISAIDIALWDRNARAAGLPLHRFLGGMADRIPAYASGGYYLDDKSPADLADEMVGYVAQGFRAVKMKIGRLPVADDTARLATVREAVGDDVLVMLDANNAFDNPVEARRAMQAWEPYDPYWIEEPFSPDDITNHARLARETSIPVATGEIEAGRWRHKQLLDAEGAIILQTDAAVCGGISEFLRIANIADAHGVSMCPHWFHDLHAPLVGAIPNGQFVEYFPTDAVLNFRRLLDRQLAHADGQLILHDLPGLGFDFDPEAVTAHQAEPWLRHIAESTDRPQPARSLA